MVIPLAAGALAVAGAAITSGATGQARAEVTPASADTSITLAAAPQILPGQTPTPR